MRRSLRICLEMNRIMAKEGCEMEEDNWPEVRIWMTDDIRASIDGEKGNIGR